MEKTSTLSPLSSRSLTLAFPNPKCSLNSSEHGERDELVRRVFSELNTAFRDRWLQIVPVDLRYE